MANQEQMRTEIPGFPATEALASHHRKSPEGMMRQGPLGFVDVSSLLLVDDLRNETPSPDLFPRIEWSRLEIYETSPLASAATNHEIAEIAERTESWRRLLGQRNKGRSTGLVRSKSLLCLPSAARDLGYVVRKEQRGLRRGSSSALLSAAARKHHKSSVLASSPLPTPQLDCIKRDTPCHPSTWLFSQHFVNSQVKQQAASKPALVAIPQEATSRSTEQKLLNSLLKDCPFPTCP